MNDLTKEARARAIDNEERYQQRNVSAFQNIDKTIGLQNLGLSPDHYGTALAGAASYYGNALAQSNIDRSYGQPKYGNDYLEPDRPLTGEPEHYLTGDEGSRCEVIKRYTPMTFKWQETGLDINEFRKFCEEIGE